MTTPHGITRSALNRIMKTTGEPEVEVLLRMSNMYGGAPFEIVEYPAPPERFWNVCEPIRLYPEEVPCKCERCSKRIYRAPEMPPNGRPICATCFDALVKRKQPPEEVAQRAALERRDVERVRKQN